MRVLFFTPHNVLPPRTGAHRRMLEVLGALRSLGAKVLVAGLKHTSDNYWDESYEARYVKASLAERVFLFDEYGNGITFLLRQARRLVQHQKWNRQLKIDLTTPEMRKWFLRLLSSWNPTTIIVNYSCYSSLAEVCSHSKSESGKNY